MTDERTEETRQLIIRKAGELFMAMGYRAVSTRMVATACGLTQPAMYHHFGGKQDLYVAVLLDELDRLQRGLSGVERRAEPGLDRLRRAALFLTERTDVDHALMFHDIRWELSPERQEHVAAAFRMSLVDPLERIVQDAISENVLRDLTRIGLPPSLVVMHFLNIVRFVSTRASEDRNQGPTISTQGSHDRSALVLMLFLTGMGTTSAKEELSMGGD